MNKYKVLLERTVSVLEQNNKQAYNFSFLQSLILLECIFELIIMISSLILPSVLEVWKIKNINIANGTKCFSYGSFISYQIF